MKLEAPATVASAIPVTAGEPVVVQPHKIPLAAKVAGTAFLAFLVPIYLPTDGPTNFLWFCDAALLLTVAGMGWKAPCSSACAPWAFCFRNASGSQTLAATFWGFAFWA